MMTKGKFSGGFLIFTVISILILFNTSNVKAANQRFIANGILGGVSFSIDLTDGSRIYWLYPGASGIATEFNFSGSQNMASYLIAWPFPMTEEDFVEDRQYYYTGKLSIPVYFSLKNRHKPLELKVKLNYLLCKTQCVPVEQNIEQRLPVKDGQVNLSSFAIADIEYDGEYLSFKARFDRAVEVPRFLATQEGFNFKASRLGDCEFSVVSPLTPEQYNKGAAFDIYSDMAVQPAKLVIQNLNDNKPANFAIILLLALLGGFILNFMPCVLPVLSLKLLALTKISGYRHLEEKSHPEFISGSHKMLKQVQGDRVSITFTLFGILVSFLTLSLISISLKNTGSHFGLGMNFQYPEFIIIMAMIITIFIGSVLGRVNISLPGKWTNFLARYRFRNEYLEGFSSGVIATILSTPVRHRF